MTKMERIDEFKVSQNEALDHAISHLIMGIITEKPGLKKWERASIDPKPLEIFDINGKLLFYEFSVDNGEQIVGRMKVSANKLLGPSVYTEEIGPRKWDAQKVIEDVSLLIKEKYKNIIIVQQQLVCYSYPKIGILFIIADKNTEKEIDRVIVDVATGKFVPKIKARIPKIGFNIWSIYKHVLKKDKNKRIMRWEADDKIVKTLKKIAEKNKINLREKLSDEEYEILKKELIFKPEKKRIGLPDNEIGAIMKVVPTLPFKLLQVPLHGQEHDCWCACATAQMILRYHHYYYSQSEIAIEMNTVPQPDDRATWDDETDPCGSCYAPLTLCGPDIENAIRTLSRNYLDAIIDDTPTFHEASEEIYNNRPFYSIVRWHARACTGVGRIDFYLHDVAAGIFYIEWGSIRIKNPWPPDPNNKFCDPYGGDEYWEDWDVDLYIPSIYVRPCAGNMLCQDDLPVI